MDGQKRNTAGPKGAYMADQKPAELDGYLSAILTSLWGAVIGAAVGHGCTRAYERAQAVNAGVGRWEIDPQTGASRFVYGPPPAPSASAP